MTIEEKNPWQIWLKLTLGRPPASHGCSPFYLFLPAQDHPQWLTGEETLTFMKILTTQAHDKEHIKLLSKASQPNMSLTSRHFWIVLTSFFTFSAISAFNSQNCLFSDPLVRTVLQKTKSNWSEAIEKEPKNFYKVEDGESDHILRDMAKSNDVKAKQHNREGNTVRRPTWTKWSFVEFTIGHVGALQWLKLVA